MVFLPVVIFLGGTMNSLKKVLFVFIAVYFSQNALADNSPKGQVIWRGTNLNATRVEGSWSDIGTQAAELSSMAPNKSEPYALHEMIKKQISDDFPFPPLAWLIGIYLDLSLFNPLEGRALPEDIAMMEAIANTSKIPLGVLKKAFVIPDAVGPLVLMNTKPTKRLAALQECSSFVAYGGQTSTGERVFGRNLDYPSIDTLDAATTVYLLKPNNAYQIISVAPEGFPVAGVSAMNEKGLVLALHDAF